MDFINLTAENLSSEHLCCIIRSKKPHPGVEAKRKWLAERLKEGHVFRKLNVKGCVFIEYAPLETAWVPKNRKRGFPTSRLPKSSVLRRLIRRSMDMSCLRSPLTEPYQGLRPV